MMLLTRGWEEACDGFRDHFAARRIPVELIVRDIATDMRRVAGLVQEVRQVRPDLVYVWGTGLAVAALGPWDAVDPAKHITGVPVVFNIVTDPVGNRLIRSNTDPGRPVTGTEYIASVEVQMRAMARYRPSPVSPPSSTRTKAIRDRLSRRRARFWAITWWNCRWR